MSRSLPFYRKPSKAALRRHFANLGLSHSVLLRWKNGFTSGGAGSLKPQYHKVDPELRALQEENTRLKNIIGNQALELEFKTELLKKTNVPFQKR